MKKKDNNIFCEPVRISLALLGGSGSGKTTFFTGILHTFVDNSVFFENGKRIYFIPRSIGMGTAEIQENATVVERVQEISTQDILEKRAREGSSDTATAFAQAGAAGRVSDDCSTKNIDISEGRTSMLTISSEIKKQVGVDEKTKKFRAGTDTTRYRVLAFDVIVDNKTRCRLTVSDYAGELIDQNQNPPEAMLKMLADHAFDSDAAIVLANADYMSQYVKDSYKNNECMFKLASTQSVLSSTRLQAIFSHREKEDYTIFLALTQKDNPKVDPRVSENNYRRAAHDLKRYIYGNLFATADERNWSYGILPVSAIGVKSDGNLNVDSNNLLLHDAEISPEGIDKAILFCLYNAVLCKIDNVIEECQQIKKGKIFLSGDDKIRYGILEQQKNDLELIRELISSDSRFFDDIYEKRFARENVAVVD